MRKKRKGSEADASVPPKDVLPSKLESASSNLKCHYSLEDCFRLKKRCKEDADNEPASSYKRRLAGIATAPPCGTSSLITPGRGLKRKIGCIDAATQMGRKKKIEDDYVPGQTIGQGKFGSVWLCRSRASGAEFACKTLKKGEETVHREVEIMQHLSGHSGVVTLQAVDIKPENILLTASGKIKLADFGLAMRISEGQNLTGLAGSPAYVAPEVLSGKYSEKVDIWSSGVLLYALLVGNLPFQGDSLEAVFEAIKNVKLDFQTGVWATISKPARDLVERMLTRDITSRITADEVLTHPWISFYTERTLKSLPSRTKMKHQVGASCGRFVTAPVTRLGRNRLGNSSLSESSSSESCDSDDEDGCVLIDALATAISHVRISEPKRSRLCGPTGPIVEQGSSNMKANNLCKAF
ncbi:hypothetical protein PIB30_032824 [Stylosanthes scabra]|uniref:Protein kinase domain-containing protein n=1 Tax=Stylosanthes scabra TaxID=79078 RepID=A0ABU6YE88_9FABA|nr:hypothetical protein [Stylosanthes scabra]